MSFQVSFESYSAIKDMVLYFKNRARYIKRLDDNYSVLSDEMGNIKFRKSQIDRDLEMSTATKEPTEEYNNLGRKIQDLEERYITLQNKYKDLQGKVASQSNGNNVVGALQVKKPTLWTRKFWKLATLSKRITRLHAHISHLNLDEKNMIIEKKPENVQVKHGAICDLPQQARYVDEIRSYLHCPAVKRISIVGTVGVGKTTILKMLNNRMKGDENCIVIWVNYPTSMDTEDKIIEVIQDEIMVKLKMNTEKTKSIDENGYRISMFLSQKRYVILMDEVSSSINLDRLGIHSVQVVVATRTRLAINYMKIDREVEVDTLPKEDAWMLLEYICGTIHDERIKDIGNMIVRCCGGLPEVIMSIAEYLKSNIEEQFWHIVKKKLQSDHNRHMLGLGGVGKAYQMMYDQLEDDYKKKCSLYGALFPDEHKIYKDYLIECWKAEGFFNDKEDVANLRAAREEGAWVLNELTNRYLLKTCSGKYVEMPIHFKKVALAQKFPGEQNSKMWVAQSMHEFPKEESWDKTTRMSLIGLLAPELPVEGTSQSAARGSNLPECPQCNNISTLLLQLNPRLQKLEDSFFLKMESLIVLDLHKTKITSLPSSISCLMNLVSLYVNECSELALLPPEIEKLLKLEILDIRKTSINPWLPRQIGSLVRLRCLRISFDHKGSNTIWKGKEVETMSLSEIIGNLKELEELIIETNICSEVWINAANQIAVALANMEHLTTLHFNFPTVESLQGFISSSRSWKNTYTEWGNITFTFFKFFVGCQQVSHQFHSDISGLLAARHLTLSLTSEETPSHDLEVLKQTSAFELIGHSSAKCLNEFNFGNMGSLKVCVVGDCNTIKSIVDVHEINGMNGGAAINHVDGCLLQSLEKLLLYNLPSLQHIWKGPFFPRSFSSLIVLKVCDCPELTEIIPEILSLLKEITVIRCTKLIKLSMTRENVKKLASIVCETSWWTRLELPVNEKEKFSGICSFIDKKEESLSNGMLDNFGESTMGIISNKKKHQMGISPETMVATSTSNNMNGG